MEEDQKTDGVIIIADTAKEKPQEGRVVAVGPDKLDGNGNRVPLEVKEGDRILFSGIPEPKLRSMVKSISSWRKTISWELSISLKRRSTTCLRK